jgi:serine/threonine protein kinase
MWAVGCILGEMLTGKPIFPGTSTINQIEKITELTGKPSKEVSLRISPYASTMMENMVSDLPDGMDKLNSLFRTSGATADAIDMMLSLLKFDPEQRLDVEGALAQKCVPSHCRVWLPFPSLLAPSFPDRFPCDIYLLPPSPKNSTLPTPLTHPNNRYVQQFHDPMVEVRARGMVKPSVDDTVKGTTAFYRDRLYQNINSGKKRADERQRERGMGGWGT